METVLFEADDLVESDEINSSMKMQFSRGNESYRHAISPSVGLRPRCTNGVDMQSRRRFWTYLDGIHPALFDAFAKEGTLLLLFTVRGDMCTWCKPTARVTSATWACSFRGHPAVPGALVVNRAGSVNTVIVECPIPATIPPPIGASLSESVTDGETVSVSYTEAGMDPHHYRDVPFCRYPGPDAWRSGLAAASAAAAPGGEAEAGRGAAAQAAQAGAVGPPQGGVAPPVPLAACTMVKSGLRRYGRPNAELLAEWLAYHRLQGVDHFLVFAHEDAAPLRRRLAPLIDEGLLVVVDWESPPHPRPGAHRGADFVPFQFLQTTSCLHRYRGLAGWVGLLDIDEFAQPLAPGATVRSAVLAAADTADAAAAAAGGGGAPVAALRMAGVYFFSRDGRPRGGSGLATQRHLARDARWRFPVGKCFARPGRVRLYQQHGPAAGGGGGAVVDLDPERVLRFNHYRNIRLSSGPVPDDSMTRYRAGIEAQLAVLGARLRAANGTRPEPGAAPPR